MDIYREATGEIWEVKPMHSVELGKAQLQTYLTGNRLGQKLKVGESAFTGQFEVYSLSGVLLRVNYSTMEGVVGYQFEAVSSPETVLLPDAVKEEDKDRVRRNARNMSSLPGLSAGDAAFCGIGLGATVALLALDRRMSGVMGGCVACLY